MILHWRQVDEIGEPYDAYSCKCGASIRVALPLAVAVYDRQGIATPHVSIESWGIDALHEYACPDCTKARDFIEKRLTQEVGAMIR